jgi:DNA-binding response OmpR family regulator
MAKIIVIDDEIEACNALEEYLANKGHKITIAHDGKTALEKIKKFMPDVVLLDIIMPGMNGQEILEQIRKIAPHINVIMVTVMDNEEQLLKSFELGAYDFLTKPLDFSRLEKVLSSIPINS